MCGLSRTMAGLPAGESGESVTPMSAGFQGARVEILKQ